MAVPYGMWGVPPMSGPPPMRGMWGIPAIPPSSNPFVVDPDTAVRDLVEYMTNGNRDLGPDDSELAWVETWAKDGDKLKIIVDVVKKRLELGWPYNYKALELAGKLPAGEILEMHETLAKLADSAASVEGAEHIKKLAKPLVDKAKEEMAKREEEDAKKKQEMIAAMWGGLWANNSYIAPALQQSGWYGYPYPWAGPPGVSTPPANQWLNKPPEGWQPSPITAVPQVYPFSRAGYYGLQPNANSPPDPPKAQPWWVSVGLGPQHSMSISKQLPAGLSEVYVKAEEARLIRGW